MCLGNLLAGLGLIKQIASRRSEAIQKSVFAMFGRESVGGGKSWKFERLSGSYSKFVDERASTVPIRLYSCICSSGKALRRIGAPLWREFRDERSRSRLIVANEVDVVSITFGRRRLLGEDGNTFVPRTYASSQLIRVRIDFDDVDIIRSRE